MIENHSSMFRVAIVVQVGCLETPVALRACNRCSCCHGCALLRVEAAFFAEYQNEPLPEIDAEDDGFYQPLLYVQDMHSTPAVRRRRYSLYEKNRDSFETLAFARFSRENLGVMSLR